MLASLMVLSLALAAPLDGTQASVGEEVLIETWTSEATHVVEGVVDCQGLPPTAEDIAMVEASSPTVDSDRGVGWREQPNRFECAVQVEVVLKGVVDRPIVIRQSLHERISGANRFRQGLRHILWLQEALGGFELLSPISFLRETPDGLAQLEGRFVSRLEGAYFLVPPRSSNRLCLKPCGRTLQAIRFWRPFVRRKRHGGRASALAGRTYDRTSPDS
ncbi:MAG: hypothetical protein R3F61_09790 [Myxococcota bacterium]